jgi:hypothetical protein
MHRFRNVRVYETKVVAAVRSLEIQIIMMMMMMGDLHEGEEKEAWKPYELLISPCSVHIFFFIQFPFSFYAPFSFFKIFTSPC